MNKQTKQIVLVAISVIAIAAAVYFAFFFNQAPKVDSAAVQAEQAITESYKTAEQELKNKDPKKAAELFAEPPPPTSPGGGIRSVGNPKPK